MKKRKTGVPASSTAIRVSAIKDGPPRIHLTIQVIGMRILRMEEEIVSLFAIPVFNLS